MLLILWINCMKYIVWIFWVSFIFLRNLSHRIDNSFFQNFFDYFCFQKMLELANFIFVFYLLIPNFSKHIVVNLFCTLFEVFKFIIKIDFNFVKIHLHYFLKWWIWYLFQNLIEHLIPLFFKLNFILLINWKWFVFIRKLFDDGIALNLLHVFHQVYLLPYLLFNTSLFFCSYFFVELVNLIIAIFKLFTH